MKLQRLHIKNFKSIVDLEIVEPNPFTVFVGPNGSGKSNIFEALELAGLMLKIDKDSYVFFKELSGEVRNRKAIEDYETISRQIQDQPLFVPINFPYPDTYIKFSYSNYANKNINLFKGITSNFEKDSDYMSNRDFSIIYHLNRVFVGNIKSEKIPLKGDSILSSSASNLEKVLKRILLDETKREEIKEWLDLFIPGFENIEIVSSDLSGTDTLVMYEKGMKKPFTKDLLSDGTYNILALLTAVYQSDEPQFLCIEEPENGLNPYVIAKLVDLFRAACEEKGHWIWLNTHSNTLVECLTPEEVIIVDKIDGETKIKQIKGMNLHGLSMAEVWLSGALGGGTPW
ncbi:MAG: AAA family ATPase [Bacteroidetes bacterium]|nr:AAA family ATPase [Bacteroidota bacterium]